MPRKIDNILTLLPNLISNRKEKIFYTTSVWENVRFEAMQDFHFECVRCRSMGIVEKAVIGHHVLRLREKPEYALSRFVAVDEETKRKVDSLAKSKGNIINICVLDGKILKLVCVDEKKERYINIDNFEMIQILPVCSRCHKEIHTTDYCDILNDKFPERW